jgi:2-oxoglutarate dehydrogenase E2 component (dihydrolipoamide succinyltransferase)
MVRSRRTSAHVATAVEVDFEAVERVRRARGAAFGAEEGFSLTYLPFIVRAFCDAVHTYPFVNASVDGDTLVVHHDVNLGIAVDLDFAGLIAPVVRDADSKRLRPVAREINDLAARARSKQLGPDEIMGGTFTITNMGPFGTTFTVPIINQPQVAILATDAIRRRPVVVEGPDGDDAIAIHSVGMLTLSWDHRAFDGAYAASFLHAVARILETRDWETELA